MPSIELTAAEVLMLTEVLNQDLSDLGMEIAGTDRKEYRDMLKVKRELLSHIVLQLGVEVGETGEN